MVGIGLIIASTIVFTISDVAAKALSATLPPLQVTWLRYLVFLAVIPIAFMRRGRSAMATRRPLIQTLRGIFMVASALLFILGLHHLAVADATALSFIGPIFITALSIPLLGEKVGIRRWLAAVVGLVGVLIVVQPGTGAFRLAALLPISAAAIWGLAVIFTRMMRDSEHPDTTLAWSALTGFAALSIIVPFDWVTPNWSEFGLGLVVGAGATLGHWLLVLAYNHAAASVLAPFTYTQLIWATALGFLVFGAVPGPATFVGAALIAASGLYTAHREQAKARAKG
jgi:drug/metabolite transporter (DMT)-like permease